MMEECLMGEFRRPLFDHRGDEPRGWVSRRAGTGRLAPLTVIRRLVAAIRSRRARARERQELRALSDHLLKDIGLTREDVGYEFPEPVLHCD
jgi:uncharacterized protein YjiS (DUF1127 family)